MLPIPAAAEEAMRRHLAELAAIQQLSMPFNFDPERRSCNGSVLAVVNFPRTSARDCNGISKFGTVYQIRLDYQRLVAIGSARIRQMLESRSQDRFRRLLKMESLPAGVDYVLDFTPPLEGEECTELTAVLWLPASTKTWWMSGHYKPLAVLTSNPRTHENLCSRPLGDKPVGAVLVQGHDDECSCFTASSNMTDVWAPMQDVPGIYDGNWVPAYRREIKDYCRVRHCMNIMRILRAIAGEDLLVNSATRMWTLAHLAVYLDAVPVVRDSITQWFSAAPNTKFIEIYPEESFKIALMLQMHDVLLASFKILVSERAVDHAAATPLTKPPKTTWTKRKRTEYGDLPEDPVEHASRVFADRVKAKFDTLQGDRVYEETLKSEEWDKLNYYTTLISNTGVAAKSPHLIFLLEDLTMLKAALLKYIHEHVRTCILTGPMGQLDRLITAQRSHYYPRGTPIQELFADCNEHQRACMPFFWYHLKELFPTFHSFRYHTYQGKHFSTIVTTFNTHLQDAIDKKHLVVSLDDFREHHKSSYHFDERFFHEQVEMQLSLLSLQMAGLRDFESNSIQFYLSDHLLLALDESETKYLPLWAGGNDDGTGGVFQDEIPPTDMGPSEPGPHYHTGHTVASSMGGTTDASSTVDGDYAGTSAYSDLGVGGLDLDDYTTARSTAAHDSVSTTLAGGRSRVVSLGSEAFESAADEDSMRDAMFQVPAGHQVLGQAVEQYFDEVSEDGGRRDTATEIDYEYDDDDVNDKCKGDDDDDDDDDDAMDTDSTIFLGSVDDDDLSDFTPLTT